MLDQILISPPLPLLVEEASTTAPACTVVVLERFSAWTLLRVPSAFCVKVTLVVPTLIRPPLAVPLALVFEPSPKVMSSPCKVILPPSALLPLPLALIVPFWLIVDATSSMMPPLLCSEEAEMRPVFLITELMRLFAAPAAIMTKPPSTLTRRLFSIRALTVDSSTLTLMRLSPRKSKVTCLPAAKATVPEPILAIKYPSLRTSGAKRAI